MKKDLFVRGGNPLVGKVPCEGDLKECVKRSVSLIGGIGRLVKEGDVVLVKPNYNTADPFPGSSDPCFVKAVVEMLYEAGAAKVVVGERTAFLNSRRVLEKAGIAKACEEVGAEVRVFGKNGWFVLLDREGWRKVRVPGGRYLREVSLAREAFEFEKIVYVPLIKAHHAAGFTGAIKLSMGFVKPFFDQLTFHAKHLQEKLAELSLVVKPDLIVMDTRKVFINRGPAKGELREPNLVMASGNQVAIDVEGVKLLQEYPGNSLSGNVWDLVQIKHAAEMGQGPRSEEEYEIVTP